MIGMVNTDLRALKKFKKNLELGARKISFNRYTVFR